jgi:hypothetical protein
MVIGTILWLESLTVAVAVIIVMLMIHRPAVVFRLAIASPVAGCLAGLLLLP